jgi:hypothetical protein
MAIFMRLRLNSTTVVSTPARATKKQSQIELHDDGRIMGEEKNGHNDLQGF